MSRRFGEFVFDSEARQLRRDGADVRLSPKAFDLLRTLLDRRPDVLSKADLLAAIWPETFVVEANLNVVIAEIRRALGDDRQAPRFIRTVHGVGYAFCGEAFDVTDGGNGAAVRGETRCWLSQKARTFPLAPGGKLICRHPRSAAWLADDSVSRLHARTRVD